jgi:MYXO-CTERM domain-containing protein
MGIKLGSSLVVCAVVLGGTGLARAERPVGGYVEVERTADQPAQDIGAGLYLVFNREATTYMPGQDDARQNRSSVTSKTSSVGGWSCSEQQWQQFMACIKDQYAPYNVVVTDQRPPAGTPYVLTHVGGKPQQVKTQQYPNGLPCSNGGCVGGIAPLGCFGGVDYGITYVFADIYQCNVQAICETAAQESAHAFGMDHVGECKDPMTYEQGCGAKKFQNIDANCGEFKNQPRQCKCPGTGSKQNSHKFLLDLFGAKPVGNPPSVEFTSPPNGATVNPGFTVTVNASDDQQVSKVELFIDGQPVGTDTTTPYQFVTSSTIALGKHTLLARATDSSSSTKESTITVNVAAAPQCQTSPDCPDGQVCMAGSCVPGPGTPGGLGEECSEGSQCASGICAAGPDGKSRCVQICDTGLQNCPDGFECLPAGGQGACWPSGDPPTSADPDDDNVSGGCGCSVGGRHPAAPLAGFFAALAMLVPMVRRRRR